MIPAEADLVAPREALNFLNSRGVDLPRQVTALEAWNLIMSQPLPGLKLAFQVRDAISALFGVERISGFSGETPAAPQVGDKLDFFLIERIEPEILTLSARDRHLETIACVTTHGGRLAITSSVKTHNFFGRLYMLPVGPAHKLIVNLMLKRARRALAQEGAG